MNRAVGWLMVMALLVAAGLLFGVPEITGVGAALGIVSLGVTLSECFKLGQVLHDALDIVAERAGLAPLRPSKPAPQPLVGAVEKPFARRS